MPNVDDLIGSETIILDLGEELHSKMGVEVEYNLLPENDIPVHQSDRTKSKEDQ